MMVQGWQVHSSVEEGEHGRKRGDWMDPLHLLHVVRPAEGGMVHHVQYLLSALAEETRQITVAIPSGSPLDQKLPKKIGRLYLEIGDGWSLSDLQAVFRLRDWLNQHQVDLLHMHGAKAAIVARLAVRWSQKSPALVYTVHNYAAPLSRGQALLFLALERWLSHETDRYIAVSRSLATYCEQRLALRPESIHVIYNSVMPSAWMEPKQAREGLGVAGDPFVIGTIARLIPEKGIAVLLQAFARLTGEIPSLRLLIIGDGPERKALEKMAQQILPQDRQQVRFCGAIPQAARYLRAFDVCVVPSLQEGFGLVALEAMAAGVPVIASHTGGLGELIRHAETGLLVPPADPLSLAQALRQLYFYSDWRKEMARRGREQAQPFLQQGRMVEETLHVYRACLAGKKEKEGSG